MTRTFSTCVPLFNTKLRLKVTDDEAMFTKHGLDNAEAGVVELEKPYRILILLRPSAARGTVAHEALHVTKRSLERAGVTFVDATEETYAYTIDWVVEWLTSKLQSNAQSKTA